MKEMEMDAEIRERILEILTAKGERKEVLNEEKDEEERIKDLHFLELKEKEKELPLLKQEKSEKNDNFFI
jgi:hypothetical protein